MKNIFLALLLLTTMISDLCGQSFTQVADMSGNRAYAVEFSIGNFGYVGCGKSMLGTFNDLWQYDPVLNTWTQVASLPAATRDGAFSFVIDTVAYIGLGANNSDCWKYFPVANVWSPVDSFPGISRNHAVAFSIGTKGYIGTGRQTVSPYQAFNDFWEYNSLTDSWTQLDSFPGARRFGAAGFAVNGYGYIGSGVDNAGNYWNNFWKYDTLSGTWTSIASFPGPTREGAIGLTLLGKGYISSGGSPVYPYNNYADLWKYDPTFNSWQQQASYSTLNPRRYVSGFVIDSSLYVGAGVYTGFDPNPIYFWDFWRYSLNLITTVPVEVGPELSAYYNATNKCITLPANSGLLQADIRVLDISGNTVFNISQNTGLSITIPADNLASGVYVIMVHREDQLFTRKILVH